MRLFSALLIASLLALSSGCGGEDSYKDREADPTVDDEVLVDDAGMDPEAPAE